MSSSTTRPDRSGRVKEAILDSARRLFAEQGYDATGIREIANDAEVNPAIVIRHFESKERLFVRSIDVPAIWNALMDAPPAHFGESMVRAVLRGRRRGLHIFGMIVQASGRPDIHDHLQRVVSTMFADPIVERIDAPDAELRAHLFAAQLVGIMAALSVYHDPVIADADEDRIVALYGRSMQSLLESVSR